MAETTYKKGELLFDETFITRQEMDSYFAQNNISKPLDEDNIIVNFNDVEYECSVAHTEWGDLYGSSDANFSVYPFMFMTTYVNEDVGYIMTLYTESAGTYNLKIYTAIPDSDSSDSSNSSNSSSEPLTIRSYITKNLSSLNWNILPQIFAENGVEMNEEIEAYLRNTPENTNWSILEQLGGSGSEEETWPKLIHIIYDGDWKMADDSDFSTFAEAYNFIRGKWNNDDVITSDYIVLKHMNEIINSDAHVGSNEIWWYKETVPYGTFYNLTENSYRVAEDS